MKSSGIRVSAGDTISVTASGRIFMTPYGNTSTTGPEGSTRYGNYSVGSKRYNGGALLARIGDSGSYQLVGTRKKWVAKKSGVLKFGVAMNASFSRGNYSFPGNYTLRIKVKPKQN